VDWKSELMKTGFEFHNPLAGRTCSCGESFSV
jgi:Fe-S cluster assembly iron-binding protein IscA